MLLASAVGEAVSEASLGPRLEYLEVSLLQPPWLGVLVSRSLLLARSPGLGEGRLDQLPASMEALLRAGRGILEAGTGSAGSSQAGNGPAVRREAGTGSAGRRDGGSGLLLEVWLHRLLGLQQAPAIFRRNWSHEVE